MKWLKSSEVSALLGISVQAVHKAAKEGKYGSEIKYEKGRGYQGKVLMIPLHSLPVHIQDQWLNKNKSSVLSTGLSGAPLDTFDEVKRKHARQKLTIVEEFLKISEHVGTEGQTVDEFLQCCKKEYPELNSSRRTLYRWIKNYKKNGLEGLIDKRGISRKGNLNISEELWTRFKHYYLDENKPTIKSCYERVMIYANKNKLDLPSISTFERKVKTIPKPVYIRWREGPRAFENKCMPFVMRDYTQLKSNQMWVTDHHQFDQMVIGPDHRLVRPWGTYFEDMRSRYIVAGYTRCVAPSADVVLACFAQGAEKYGLVDEIILDNGKDYRTADIFHTDDKAKISSIAKQLDIVPHYALPYNAKAKPIERVFRTFEEQFGKLWKSYCGNQVYNRPERLKEMGLEEYPTFEEWQELHDMYIEKWYNQSPHRGQGMDNKSPSEVYHACLEEKRIAPKSVLRMLFMRTTKPLTVHRNGIKLFNKFFYSTQLMDVLGCKVFARYNPNQINTIYVYNEKDDTFLCVAYCREYNGWTSEDIKQLKRDKKVLSNVVHTYKEHVPDILDGTAGVREIIEEMGNQLEKKMNKEKSSKTVLKPVINQSVGHAVKAAKKSKNPDNLEHHEDVSREEENPLSDYFEKVLKSMEGN